MPVFWHIQSSTNSAGAIGIVQIAGEPEALNQTLQSLNLPQLEVGQVVLHDFLGIDRGVMARWSESSVHLFPHGGVAILRRLAGALHAAGVDEASALAGADRDDGESVLLHLFPETGSRIEARMLEALARAASPLAVDLLLDQPRRWAEIETPEDVDHQGPRHATLRRLIEPPLVVAIGPSNIGKSSLLNALAGRGVSLVADEPGTTRDHVGALIDMAGLVVRYIDSPGIREGAGAAEGEAVELAAAVARRADLVLSCGDALHAPLRGQEGRTMVLGLRSDLGGPEWACDQAVSARTGYGLTNLVQKVRDRLVPPEMRTDPAAWVFWPQTPESTPTA